MPIHSLTHFLKHLPCTLLPTMTNVLFLFLVLVFSLLLLFPFSLSTPDTAAASEGLLRPLILQFPSTAADPDEDDVRMRCSSWRVAGEANNLVPWKIVPDSCAAYVQNYVTGKAYLYDLEMVAAQASAYARSLLIAADGRDAWVFDIDETLLSNLPYYSAHGYGSELFDGKEFDRWVEMASAPAIESSLKLYQEILELGFKVVLLTGRGEVQRLATVDNLRRAGFQDWDKLILRGADDYGKLGTMFKSEKRSEIISAGYRILGNSGDQWSDLLGHPMSNRSFKLPNPMYHIP